jgi:hypothetical protein
MGKRGWRDARAVGAVLVCGYQPPRRTAASSALLAPQGQPIHRLLLDCGTHACEWNGRLGKAAFCRGWCAWGAGVRSKRPPPHLGSLPAACCPAGVGPAGEACQGVRRSKLSAHRRWAVHRCVVCPTVGCGLLLVSCVCNLLPARTLRPRGAPPPQHHHHHHLLAHFVQI